MINIQIVGWAKAIAAIGTIKKNLANPTPGLEKATNAVAGVFGQNFDSEGGLVGGWPELAEQTQNMRVWQGFDPDHPIMIRYGALRGIAVEFFQHARAGYRGSSTDDYSGQTVSGSLEINHNRAVLQMGGSYKVLNQFGYPDTNGSGDNPARPFWFVNKASTEAARSAVIVWIKDDIISVI